MKKHAQWTGTVLMALMVVCAAIAWLWPQETSAAVQREGIRIDAGSSQTITFTVPADTPKTWIRIVTDPGITPLWYSLERGADPIVTIRSTDGVNQVKPIPNGLSDPIADAVYQFNAPAVNVYSIILDNRPYRMVFPAETWTLTVQNKSLVLGIFAVYISSVSAVETEGGNIWLRDNATVDPSGHHILSNIANLDTTAVPTPNEWWKSPSIRFTTLAGTPTKNPVGGQHNNVYIKVHNFGTLPVSSTITVEAWWTHFTTSLPPFGDPAWNPLGSQTVTGIDPGTGKETAAFDWNVPPVPPASEPNHYCIYARVSVSAGPLDPVNFSSMVVDWLTPNNTNATHRNVMIISAVDPPPAGPFPYFFKQPVRFYIANWREKEVLTNVKIKGLPVAARASNILIQDLAGEELILTGIKKLQRVKLDLEPAVSGTMPKQPPITPREGAVETLPEVSTRTAVTEPTITAISMTKFEIVDNEQISVDGIQLKPGERRLVELQIALAEPFKGQTDIPVDIVQYIDGKPAGGVTAVLAFSGDKVKRSFFRRVWDRIKRTFDP